MIQHKHLYALLERCMLFCTHLTPLSFVRLSDCYERSNVEYLKEGTCMTRKIVKMPVPPEV